MTIFIFQHEAVPVNVDTLEDVVTGMLTKDSDQPVRKYFDTYNVCSSKVKVLRTSRGNNMMG